MSLGNLGREFVTVGPVPTNTDEERDRATQYVRRHASSKEDAKLLLLMLGLSEGE